MQQPGALETVAMDANEDGRMVQVGVAANGAIYERTQTTPDGTWDPFVQQPGALATVAWTPTRTVAWCRSA